MTTSAHASSGGAASQDPLFAWSPPDSPASPSASPAHRRARKTSGTSGPRFTTPFASYDRTSRSWRTFRVSFDGNSETYSGTWPRSGMTRSGTVYRRRPSVPRTYAIECSSLPTPTATPGGYNQSPSPGAAVRPSLETMARHGLWPTPTAAPSSHGGGGGVLHAAVTRWPTPRSADADRGGRGDLLSMVRHGVPSRRRDRKLLPTPLAKDGARGGLTAAARERRAANTKTGLSLPEELGGPLNPTWVEWLMGFPAGWTDCAPSATP